MPWEQYTHQHILTSSWTILKEKYVFPLLEGLSLNYLIFMDDIFFIWTGSKGQLIKFLNDLNTKHKSHNKASLFLKETDRQNFLLINSEDPISLKNSIPYSQVLRVKLTCSMIEKFKLYCSELKEKFIEKGCKSDISDKHISTA